MTPVEPHGSHAKSTALVKIEGEPPVCTTQLAPDQVPASICLVDIMELSSTTVIMILFEVDTGSLFMMTNLTSFVSVAGKSVSWLAGADQLEVPGFHLTQLAELAPLPAKATAAPDDVS